MKIVYVHPTDFSCSMISKAGYLEVTTEVFNTFTDNEIERYMLVPFGYTWTDPVTKEVCTGEYLRYNAPQSLDIGQQLKLLLEAQEVANAQIAYSAMMTDTLMGEA